MSKRNKWQESAMSLKAALDAHVEPEPAPVAESTQSHTDAPAIIATDVVYMDFVSGLKERDRIKEVADRLVREHGWNQWLASTAAAYYLGELTLDQLKQDIATEEEVRAIVYWR